MIDCAELFPTLDVDKGFNGGVVSSHLQHGCCEVAQTRVQPWQYAILWASEAALLLMWVVCVDVADILTLEAHEDEEKVVDYGGFLVFQRQVIQGFGL